MKHPIADLVDLRLTESLERIEQRVDHRPFKIAAWGLATTATLGAVAAAFGAVAAGAGAYIAVRSAIDRRREHQQTTTPRQVDLTS